VVTVAVVSWNTRDLLVRCLRSLEPEVEAGRASVWVVDNGSSDGSVEAARRTAPWAQILEPGRNLGYGPAVNLVASQTDSEWIAAANADVALEPGALEALLTAGADERVGAVAPRLLLPDGTTQQSVHHFPTLPFTLAFNLGLRRLNRRLGDRFYLEDRWDPERPRTVDWALGAFLLLRRRAFHGVGGFSEDQWMYAEDLDLAWRLRDAGWVTAYVPEGRVLHDAGAATSPAFGDDKTARYMAATYRVLARRKGSAQAWATALINYASVGLRLLVATPLARLSPRWRSRHDFYRGWFRAHQEALRWRTR
jgi:GT2 family glycosyltransferase